MSELPPNTSGICCSDDSESARWVDLVTGKVYLQTKTHICTCDSFRTIVPAQILIKFGNSGVHLLILILILFRSSSASSNVAVRSARRVAESRCTDGEFDGEFVLVSFCFYRLDIFVTPIPFSSLHGHYFTRCSTSLRILFIDR